MSQPEDQYYIDAILNNGDTNAFGFLVNRYKHMVFTLAMKMIKNTEEAEEISQDVFLKAYHALDKFKGEAKFSTWIYKITYFRSLDYIKKQKRRLRTSSIDDEVEYHLPSVDNTLAELEVDERKKTIRKAIGNLPENDALVITLHYLEELSLKEISDIMDLPVNTLKVRLFRSRKRLAGLLKNELQPDMLENYGRE